MFCNFILTEKVTNVVVWYVNMYLITPDVRYTRHKKKTRLLNNKCTSGKIKKKKRHIIYYVWRLVSITHNPFYDKYTHTHIHLYTLYILLSLNYLNYVNKFIIYVVVSIKFGLFFSNLFKHPTTLQLPLSILFTISFPHKILYKH